MHRDIARHLVLLGVLLRIICIVTPPGLLCTSGQQHRSSGSHESDATDSGRINLRASHSFGRPRPGGPVPPSVLRSMAPEPHRLLGRDARGNATPDLRAPAPLDRPVARVPVTAAAAAAASVVDRASGLTRRRAHRGRRAQHRQRGRRGGKSWHLGKSGDNFKICAINIQSIKPKIVYLNGELNLFGYDIMIVCETWLKPNTPNRLLVFPGYQLMRSDRKFSPAGYGGVGFLVRKGIGSTKIYVPAPSDNNSRLESIWRLFKWGRQQLVMGGVYRSPRTAAADLDADLNELEAQYQHVLLHHPGLPIIIGGDLNCCLLVDTGTHLSGKKLRDFLQRHSLYQVISSPTYSTGSLLDVFIVNRDFVTRAGTRFCHSSPHRFIRLMCSFPRHKQKPTVTKGRLLRRIDPVEYHLDLLNCDWDPVYSAANVADMWSQFANNMTDVLDQHAPVRSIKIRNPTAPNVSAPTRKLMSQRAVALSCRGRDSNEYRAANRAVRAAVRADVRLCIQDSVDADGPASVWRHMRRVVSRKQDKASTSPAFSPDVLNDFFVDVGPKVTAEVIAGGNVLPVPVRLPRVGACAFSLKPVTLDFLGKTISQMRNSAACGNDGLCIRVFKMSYSSIGPILLHIVNSCLTLNEIPSSWKHALIHPILKSGDPDSPSNYRPISILPVITKVVEKVVQRQLQLYLSNNHLLSPTQHGFRCNHSTETALIQITDRALSAMDQGHLSLLCLIDLSKAFDVICHSKLLEKLQLHGIDIAWFKNYLSGHTQSVTAPGRSSAPRPIKQGVFQGSSLGPLLFTIFTNDLSLHAAGTFVIQYADDTQILVSGPKSDLPELASKLETALLFLERYFRYNGLKINEKKFELLPIGSRQNLRNLPNFSVNFHQTTLEPCMEAKNLGVTFDRFLTWDSHVSKLTQKCFGILTGISHIRHHIPPSAVPILVSALVLSHIRYCLSVFGNGSSKNLQSINKILNFAARVISGKKKFDHISSVRKSLGWLHPSAMVQHQTLNLLFKIQRSGEPESLAAQIFTNAQRENRHRSTRQDHLLCLPRIRGSAAGKRQFMYRATTGYNNLPQECGTMSASVFSATVRRLLLELCDNH